MAGAAPTTVHAQPRLAPALPHSGGATSIQAAFSMLEHAPAQRERVLRALRDAGWAGKTRDELQHELGISGDALRPRVWQLIKDGYVRETGGTRKTAAGRAAYILVALCSECGRDLSNTGYAGHCADCAARELS